MRDEFHDHKSWRNLGGSHSKGCPADSYSCRLGFPFRRHSEISFPRFTGSWTVCEDRYSLAAGHGSFCWRCRNCLRSAVVSRVDYAPCLHPTSDRHLRGVVLDKDRDACKERALEHVARSPHRREYAAWSDFSTAGWRRNAVPRRTCLRKGWL